MSWRAEKSSIFAIAVGGPEGDEETLASFSEQRKDRHGDRLEDRAHHVHPAVRGERAEHGIPIERHVDRHEQEIDRAGQLFHRRRISADEDMVRAETAGLGEFVFARGERGDVAAKGGREFHRHVTQAADAHDPDAARRIGVRRGSG